MREEKTRKPHNDYELFTQSDRAFEQTSHKLILHDAAARLCEELHKRTSHESLSQRVIKL